MGGSLALAIKNKKFSSKVSAIVRTLERKKEAESYNIAEKIYLEDEFLASNLWDEFDFIVLALPIDLTCQKIDLIPENYSGFITDLGSSKTAIINKVESKYPKSHNYYSSHPMTGSEHSGLKYGKEDLYDNKLCILTPASRVSAEAAERVSSFWAQIGSQIITINAVDHDEILSLVSHSPHILSSLLAEWIGQNEKVIQYTKNSPLPLTGGGFRDMSRIAGSNPDMWDAIINTNREFIYSGLITFRDKLTELIEHLNPNNGCTKGFWKEYFKESKSHRDKILKMNE